MSWIDPSIIALYLIGMLVIGIRCSRQASQGMESYFLGGNKTRWWVLAASGSASNYDVTGTMFLVSVFYLMGLKSLYLWWSWQFFGAAFLAAYMGLWVYRTKAMTAVELLHIRFGDGRGGRFARSAGAILMIVFLLFSLGYSFVGISKFLPMILPADLPHHDNGKLWAVVIMLTTMVYVTAGGFKGVVLTDMIQAILMSVAGLVVAGVVYMKLDAEAIGVIRENFATSLAPVEVLDPAKGAEGWNQFGKFLPYWLAMGFLIHMNGAGGHYQEQRFLACRSERDSLKVGLGWGLFLVPRWMLIAGITFVAVAGVVKVTDPELILPLVINEMLPVGLRGLVLAGLAAAFMSTLSSVLNAASGMVVRDLVQPAMPQLADKTLVRISYVVTIVALLLGFAIGSQADSISGIWSWMLSGLIGGMLIPNILRWHWWRLNGTGYALGLLVAMAVAAVTGFGGFLSGLPGSEKAALWPSWMVGFASRNPWIALPEYVSAPVIWFASVVGAVGGSLLSKPTEMDDLVRFYSRVRPFGLWGPVKKAAEQAGLEPLVGPARSPGRIVLNVCLFMVLLVGLYYGAFLLIGHFFAQGLLWLGAASAAGITLFFSWFKPLGELSNE
ncbi:MAG: hypothetical protein O3A87_00265 [Verrucomicrobia bacterium]|nr:hypothetical protein [Verrucomicrobiota bacterium]MDA1004901.1 hypothetical protein [Verrucomicrobiota bacterium]